MADEFGTGALPSPPDDRDWIATEAGLAAAAGPAAGMATFRLGNRPPVTNQLNTPECVAYSSGVEQNWQDRVEHGHFFDFWEHRFFENIGGTAAGAFMRAALDERRAHGFPEADGTPSPTQHKIEAYAQVPKTVEAIKNAIVATGGVLVVGPWFENWTERHGTLQVLPPPSGAGNGHAFWGVGWDEYGLLCQNSWGTLWGDQGLFRMPWAHVVSYMWEIWTTLDDQTLIVIARARIRERGTYLRRPKAVIGDDAKKLGPKSIWGQARRAGIWRRATDSIVAKPWDQPFKYRGKRNGARHGDGPRGETWALLGIAGNEVAVPITDVQIVL